MPSHRQVFVLVVFAINAILTYIGNVHAYGKTNGEVSDNYHTLITPPGYAFSIWALIFTWEGVAAVSQCLPLRATSTCITSTPLWIVGWVLTSAAQATWSIAFAREAIGVSMSLMIVIWIGLVAALISANRTATLSLATLTGGAAPFSAYIEWLLYVAPFSLHLGWITAAMCVNGSVLAVAGCASLSAQLALVILTLVFCSIMMYQVSIRGTNVAFASSVSWALFSLRDRNSSKAVCVSGDSAFVPSAPLADAITTASTVIAAVLLSLSVIRSLSSFVVAQSSAVSEGIANMKASATAVMYGEGNGDVGLNTIKGESEAAHLV